jgi:hypothetical protein
MATVRPWATLGAPEDGSTAAGGATAASVARADLCRCPLSCIPADALLAYHGLDRPQALQDKDAQTLMELQDKLEMNVGYLGMVRQQPGPGPAGRGAAERCWAALLAAPSSVASKPGPHDARAAPPHSAAHGAPHRRRSSSGTGAGAAR